MKHKTTWTLLALAIGIACHSWSDAPAVRQLALKVGLGALTHELGSATRELEALLRRHAPTLPSPADDEVAATDPQGCRAQLPGGRLPQFANAAWQKDLTLLCYREFGLAYSARTRTPLWVAEHLTAARVERARQQERKDSFHPDPHLPEAVRASLADYDNSGWDRGHMAPSGDMSTPAAQHESFTLANMVPQDPENNRRIWSSIEGGVRNHVQRAGAAYVITGPLYLTAAGQKIRMLNHSVAVPTHLWKLVHDPTTKSAGVFLVKNAHPAPIQWLTVAQFERTSGYRFGLEGVAPMTMPKPHVYSR